MTDTKLIDTAEMPNWCPGCGNFSIWTALKQSIIELGLKPHETVLVSGIGCSSKYPHWIKTYGFHTIHGRALPVATGIKLANNKLKVITIGGDGDGYCIGTAHTVHTMRRNIDITYIVCDNQIYGLTKGQTSPTSEKGFKSKSTPFGVIEDPINPLTLALTTDATFIARGYAGDAVHLKELVKQAIMHRGISLLDILQPCVTWNKLNTYEYFNKRVYKLKTPFKTRLDAYAAAQEWNEKIPIGVFYTEKKATYEDECPTIKTTPLVNQSIANIDITKVLKRYY